MNTFAVDPTPEQVAIQWKDIAVEVALLIRSRGVDFFQKHVKQVAKERREALDEKERRETERRNALKKHGHLELPDRPKSEPGAILDWFDWTELFEGRITLPPEHRELDLPPDRPQCPISPACLIKRKPSDKSDKCDRQAIATFREKLEKFRVEDREYWSKWEKARRVLFDLAKDRGFPDDEEGVEYQFDVVGWLPSELSPNLDTSDPLPVPKRKLSFSEKIAGLSAIHDAFLDGRENVDPWAAMDIWEKPGFLSLPPFCDADLETREQIYWYCSWVQKVEQLGPECIGDVKLWLADVQEELAKPPETPRTNKEDKIGIGNNSEQLTPEAKAILFVQQQLKTTGQLPPKTAIANRLGVDRRTLNNWTAFKVAYTKMKADLAKSRPPARGWKTEDGTVDGYRENGK